MKVRRLLISYLFIFSLLYLATFIILFSSNESFYSIKWVVLINGILNLIILFIDKNNNLLFCYPLFFFFKSYLLIESYMFFTYWRQMFLSFEKILYPFTNGRNGFLFTFIFTLIIWLGLLIVQKMEKK